MFLGPLVVSSPAAFSSLYVFGDGTCTTSGNPSPQNFYYGKRYCNGRIWIEVLAQRQGLPYETNKNVSFFGHTSTALLTNVNNLAATDLTNDLFVIWVNDADFVGYMQNTSFSPYSSNNLAIWTNAIIQSVTNHWKAITNLYYAKGVRTLAMPNAVDIMKTYNYNGLNASQKNFVRARIMDFNARLGAMADQARSTLPGVKILVPDFFVLLDYLATNSATFGMVNPNTNAVEKFAPNISPTNGVGANYLFWDYLNPSAMAHMVMADFAQQLLSPVHLSELTGTSGSNWISIANNPVGRAGFVEGSVNLVNWTVRASVPTNNTTETVLVPTAGPMEFYRLRYPFAWTWP